MARVYNFAAGPATLPEEVLQEAADEMLDFNGSGLGVMEMSHRSKAFEKIIGEAKQDLIDLMGIPEDYEVLFVQGGASQQFAAVPMNLMKNRVADYIVTGQWAKKAFTEGKIFGQANKIASSEDKTFSYIPDCSDLPISDNADYVYICENETIHGITYKNLPDTKGKILVSDQSSMFLSKPCNVSDYGMIYGGVQKNIGPAGLSIVIIREDLIREDIDPKTPVYLRYDTHANNGSMYNTPNCWAIYVCGKVFKYLKKLEGKAIYCEDLTYRLMAYDDVKMIYCPYAIAMYGYGQGISTAGNSKWAERMLNDVRASNDVILTSADKDDSFNKLMKQAFAERYTGDSEKTKKFFMKHPALLLYKVKMEKSSRSTVLEYNASFVDKILDVEGALHG